MKTAFIFPGQGSQFISMGKELFETFVEAKEVFQEIDDTLNQKLSTMMFEGDIADLSLTSNTQPAIMAVSIAAFKVLSKQGNFKSPNIMAGHSLGEYSALCAAETFSVKDTAKILRIRGDSMQEAVPKGEGAMVALIANDYDSVKDLLTEANNIGICDMANDNGVNQFVLSGTTKAIEFVKENYSKFNIRKAIPLNVSAPFHCRLMVKASEKMKVVLDEIEVKLPNIPIINNIDVVEYSLVEQIKTSLVRQVYEGVRWRETMDKFIGMGVEHFVEVGPNKILSTLLKKSFTNIKISSISSPKEIEEYFNV